MAKCSTSHVFGAVALSVSISQALLYGATLNGMHVNPRVTAVVGVLTTAIAWLARSPIAHKIGLDQAACPIPAEDKQP